MLEELAELRRRRDVDGKAVGELGAYLPREPRRELEPEAGLRTLRRVFSLAILVPHGAAVAMEALGPEVGGFRSNSALTKPFNAIAKAMNLTKQISPKAMRRSFQDAMREAEVANVVVRSISGHLTEQMQQRYSTARGHEQEQAIARIVDLTRVKRHIAPSAGSPMDSKVDSIGGQHEKAG
jgi:hypothetical protein